ncbi:MAG: rhodanese-like domain-containing protein [Cyanobacteria bacterium P01_G01_bin.49]
MIILHHLKWSLLNWGLRLKFPSVLHISSDELADWLDDKQRNSPLLLDTRSPLEYTISHLKNAYLIPSTTQELTHLLGLVPSTPIVTYCSIGYRSAKVAQQLQNLGYEQVFNLEGSLLIWFSENRPVYQEGEPVVHIHPYNRFWSFWL